MNTDVRIDVTLPTHRKFVRLRRVVGDRAMEHLVRLWIAAATGATSGRLEGWTADDIEAAADWDGDPGRFAEALVCCGWIDRDGDTYMLHDWATHQPWVTGAPERTEAARSAGRARWAGTTPAQRSDAARTAARARWDRTSDLPDSAVDADPMRTQCEPPHAPRTQDASGMRAPSPSPSPSPSPLNPSSSPAATAAEPAGFAEFWQAYPRKVGKAAAMKAWVRLNGNGRLAEILAAIERAKLSRQWQEAGGQYIPYPSTWLNRGGWDDELDPEALPCADHRTRL